MYQPLGKYCKDKFKSVAFLSTQVFVVMFTTISTETPAHTVHGLYNNISIVH